MARRGGEAAVASEKGSVQRLRDGALRHMAMQNLSGLDIDQVRDVQRFAPGEHATPDRGANLRAEENFDQHGRVVYDHLLSRSAQTASAASNAGETGSRVARRAPPRPSRSQPTRPTLRLRSTRRLCRREKAQRS
jgi:hypothetical protein